MKKIILIDDDSDDIELFKEALEEARLSLQFNCFKDAQAAFIELTSKNCSLPDLIFLDINLPVVSGWEFLKQIRNIEVLSGIPVIMYTTSSQIKEREMATRLGATGFITKPSDFNQLKSTLENAVKKHLQLQ